MIIGRGQVSILRSTVDRWFKAGDNRRYRQCLRLHARGLLIRDPSDGWRFTASPSGREAIFAHDSALADKLEAAA
jgi:hypothetical protein